MKSLLAIKNKKKESRDSKLRKEVQWRRRRRQKVSFICWNVRSPVSPKINNEGSPLMNVLSLLFLSEFKVK